MKPKFCVGDHVVVVDGQPQYIGASGKVTRVEEAYDEVRDRFICCVVFDHPVGSVSVELFFEWKLQHEPESKTDISNDALMEVLSGN